MKDQLKKLRQETCTVSHNAISSPGSAGGPSRSNSPESRQQPDSGLGLHHASRSVLPGSNSDSLTLGTSPRYSSASSASADLQSSLGNRLRQQLQNRGCATYKLTWKEKTTPSGLPYSQLVASALRTKETGYSLELGNWPSPTANSNDRTAVPENALTMYRKDGSKIQQRLQDFAAITQPIRITASGQMLTGSDAGTENSGQLNPAHSRWLMGFPPEWDDCAVTAMQLFRKSPPNSYPLSWRRRLKLRAK